MRTMLMQKRDNSYHVILDVRGARTDLTLSNVEANCDENKITYISSK